MRSHHCCTGLQRLSSHTYPCKRLLTSGARQQIAPALSSGFRSSKAKILRPTLSNTGGSDLWVHSATSTVKYTALRKPVGLYSVMDTTLSNQSVPMTPVNTAPKNKRARKPATAAAASEPAMQDNNLHEVGVKLEGQHITNGASQPHKMVVETAGLATALELTGSAEPKNKQARQKPSATAVVGPATPAIEHAPSRAAAEAKSLIEERKAVMAAVAAAMRGAGAKPKKESVQQQKQPDTVAPVGMPIIPLAERVKGRARRTKTAPSALEIHVKAEDDGELEAGTAAEAQAKKPRKRAAKNVVCDAADESHAAEAEIAEAAVPAKKARAPRKKPAAAAEEKEVPVRPLYVHFISPARSRSRRAGAPSNLHSCISPPCKISHCKCWQGLT